VKLRPTHISAVVHITPTLHSDERGAFARTFCTKIFSEHGLDARIAQCSISRNTRAGTLRGMHFQTSPFEEAKLVRCTAGAIFDVAVDVRPQSKTFGAWVGATLSAENGEALFIPAGFAHGFLTLSDETEVFYQISTAYAPEAARGFSYDDPDVGIAWPQPPAVISERDAALPPLASTIAADRP
jgi:dTDP-4-dehydrorhamnose 3,5-epimerase